MKTPTEKRDLFWHFYALVTAVKLALLPAWHSTDFEVHRNWLAITHSLPLQRWYVDATSEWTLDYPPFFAYFEFGLSQVAKFVDAQMLQVQSLNYDTQATIYFQRLTVIISDVVFALGVRRCLEALQVAKGTTRRHAAELALLCNVGLLFIDHIHFQYNGFLFGLLLLSISCLLEERLLWSAFSFAALLNFKHIFLYMAPAFGAYFLRFYCCRAGSTSLRLQRFSKMLFVGLLPFVLAFGPFYRQLPQVLSRLFPFKRGLTHAYWAPNFWAIYNTFDKTLATALRLPKHSASNTGGLVQEYEHDVLPSITPLMTFLLTFVSMLPCIFKLLQCPVETARHQLFLRCLVICSMSAFMFGWHVHEKAILMVLIPLSLLWMSSETDAAYSFLLSVVGYFSLFPLLFHTDLLLIRYSLFLCFICGLYACITKLYGNRPALPWYAWTYVVGFLLLPLYEHVLSALLQLQQRWPFMPLLLTSLYCSIGVLYFYIMYYHVVLFETDTGMKIRLITKSKQLQETTKLQLKLKKN